MENSHAESEAVANLIPKAKFQTLQGIPHSIEQIDNQQLVDYIHAEF